MKQKMKNMKIMVLLDVSVYNIYISRPCNISEDMSKSLRIFLIVILTPKHPYSEYKIIYQKEKKKTTKMDDSTENGKCNSYESLKIMAVAFFSRFILGC